MTIAGVAALSYFNIISNPYGKFYAVINPFVRGDVPIIASVAEHQPATWSSFFYEFGAILAPRHVRIRIHFAKSKK